jgi:hypothetical protein
MARNGYICSMENWKQISYAPNYEISDFGNVRSFKRKRLLSQKTKKNGYKEVCLYIDKKPYMNYVHRIVVLEFANILPKYLEVNHIDGVKANNKLGNLEIVTPSENRKHSYHVLGNKIGIYKGSNHGMSKINEETVLQIRHRYKDGVTPKALSESYNIPKSTICKVIYRQTWNHI